MLATPVYAICKYCDSTFRAADDAPLPDFCTERCSGRWRDRHAPRPMWQKLCIAGLCIGLVAAGIQRKPLARYLVENVEAVRPHAARALAVFGAVDELVDLVLGSDPGPRSAALVALAQVPDPQAARAAVLPRHDQLAALRPQLDVPGQAAWLRAMGRCRLIEEFETFTTALTSDSLASAALEGLGSLGDARAIEVLTATIQDTAEDRAPFKGVAIEALGRLVDSQHRGVPTLLTMLESSDPHLRREAAVALGRHCADSLAIKEQLSGATDEAQKTALRAGVGNASLAASKLKQMAAKEVDDEARKAMREAYGTITLKDLE